MSILDEILAHKASEVAAARAIRPAEDLRAAAPGVAPHRPFEAALRPRPGARPRIIAEVKRRSPSKGAIRAEADPVAVARAYEAGGAAAVSVLTDARYFGGSLDDLLAVRAAVALPVLRKDFIIDAYQLAESAAAGADAVLLIVRALPGDRLGRLLDESRRLGLEALVEVHDAAEMAAAAAAGATVIGINNRDLRTFTVDTGLTLRLAPLAPRGAVVVTESGIATPADIDALASAGVSAFLIGESLMRADDPAAALRRLREAGR
ncbi:MAG TPA: indole-3-glycerol phosphate synthase TrpC [Thermodesulfobacteriota bacterium]